MKPELINLYSHFVLSKFDPSNNKQQHKIIHG